jgi:enoyl-CoA hydratase/carnithine racemase
VMSVAALPMTLAPLLRIEDQPRCVRVLTLDNPGSRNALSLAMLDALAAALADAGRDPTVRVLVIAAEGSVYSAGHDVKELTGHRADADGGRAFFDETFARCSRMMQAIVALPKPVIAAVEGLATAAGCQLVATCDLAVAGAEARFCTPGVSIGLFCTTPMVGIVRNVARKHAMEMLLTGEPIPAEEAFRIGLVNRVVPQGHALPVAVALARKIASRSALTVSTGKRAFYDDIGRPLQDAYDRASRVMTENMLAEDAVEGLGALIERREPHWRDR